MAVLKALFSIVILQGLGAAFAFATVLVLTAVLGAEGYGLYVWVVSAAGVIALLIQRGLPTTIVKEYAPLDLASLEIPSAIANTQALFTYGSGAAIALAGLVYAVVGPFEGLNVALVLPVALALVSLAVSDAILRAAEQGVRAQFASQVVRTGIILAGAVLLSRIDIKTPTAFLFLFSGATLFSSVVFLYSVSLIPIRCWGGGGWIRSNAAHFQVSVSGSVANYLPIFLTGLFVSYELLAYLAVAIRLAAPLTFGVTAARSFFGARINRCIKAKNAEAARADFRLSALFSFGVSVLATIAVASLLIGMRYYGLGPLVDFSNTALIVIVIATVMVAQLARAAVGPAQLVALLLGDERFVRNYNLLMLAFFAVGLLLAGVIGKIWISAAVLLLYNAAVYIGLGVRVNALFRRYR